MTAAATATARTATKKWLPLSSSLQRKASTSTSSSSSSSCSEFPMKNVIRRNFKSALSGLRRIVKDALFVAVDLEMSGVASAPWRETFDFDCPSVRYLKLKDSAEKFAVLQFGVCPFRWDTSSRALVAYPHNVYIFPREELSVGLPVQEFLWQTASVGFLAHHHFDFNTCINEGVSYLSRAQEIEARKLMEKTSNNGFKKNLETTREIPLTSPIDIHFTTKMTIQIDEWRNTLMGSKKRHRKAKQGSSGTGAKLQTMSFKHRPSLLLNGFTPHQLTLIQQVLAAEHFNDLRYVSSDDEMSIQRHSIVYTTLEDYVDLMEEVRKDSNKIMETKLEVAVGFRHVIDLLASEKKLIVGHNCLLDLAHIHTKFLGPLPPTLPEFASSIHENFPYIIDTKHLLRTAPNLSELTKRTHSLSGAFSRLCSHMFEDSNSPASTSDDIKVELETDGTRSVKWTPGLKHEAGYDAFMTGCIFAKSCGLLGIDIGITSAKSLLENGRLQRHLNMIYARANGQLMVNISNGKFLKVSGSMLSPTEFSNIIFIWGFPKPIARIDLRTSLSKVFGFGAVSDVMVIDESAFAIKFRTEQLTSDFLVFKDVLERSNDLTPVLNHPLSSLLEGGNTKAGKYDVYEEVCRASASQLLFAEQAETLDFKWKTKLDVEDVAESKETEIMKGTDHESKFDSILEILKDKKHQLGGDATTAVTNQQILDALVAAGKQGKKLKS